MPIDNRYNMPPTGSQGYGFGGPAHQQGAPLRLPAAAKPLRMG